MGHYYLNKLQGFLEGWRTTVLKYLAIAQKYIAN